MAYSSSLLSKICGKCSGLRFIKLIVIIIELIIIIRELNRNNINKNLLFFPIQLLTQPQWWSKFNTQTLHI